MAEQEAHRKIDYKIMSGGYTNDATKWVELQLTYRIENLNSLASVTELAALARKLVREATAP